MDSGGGNHRPCALDGGRSPIRRRRILIVNSGEHLRCDVFRAEPAGWILRRVLGAQWGGAPLAGGSGGRGNSGTVRAQWGEVCPARMLKLPTISSPAAAKGPFGERSAAKASHSRWTEAWPEGHRAPQPTRPLRSRSPRLPRIAHARGGATRPSEVRPQNGQMGHGPAPAVRGCAIFGK